jgi:hypothetical protein
MKLTESEEKFLARFEKANRINYLNYVAGGISICFAIWSLITFMISGNKVGLAMTLLFGQLGFTLLLVTKQHRKLGKIIEKIRKVPDALGEKAKDNGTNLQE